MNRFPLALGIAATLTLAGCTTPVGPVEVTRFVAPEQAAQLGQGLRGGGG